MLYDVANSAYVLRLTTAIFPLFLQERDRSNGSGRGLHGPAGVREQCVHPADHGARSAGRLTRGARNGSSWRFFGLGVAATILAFVPAARAENWRCWHPPYRWRSVLHDHAGRQPSGRHRFTLGDVVALSYRRVNASPYGTCTYGIRTACLDFPVFRERTALMRS